VAVAALMLLFLHASKNPHALLTVAIGLFMLAAVGGVVLLANDLHHRPGPRFLVAGHAIVGVGALGLVLIVVFA
ncbi:MAG TPA: hypothetical protein VHN79_06190, partial [Lacunisphaera sp.]|nr:hypothetical protein [Lacunisphaera sp.]